MEVNCLPKGRQDLQLIILVGNQNPAQQQNTISTLLIKGTNTQMFNKYVYNKSEKSKRNYGEMRFFQKTPSCQASWESEPKKRYFVHPSTCPLTLPLTYLYPQLNSSISSREGFMLALGLARASVHRLKC